LSGAVAAGCVTPTITRAFYAEQDTRTPVRVSVVAVFINFVLNLALVGPLEEAGLALATSISQVGQLVALYVLQGWRRREAGGEAGHGRVLVALGRASFLCTAMGVAAWATQHSLQSALGDAFEKHGSLRAATLAASIGAAGCTYFGLAWITRAPELVAILGLRAARARRRETAAA
jgi:putative peptidoglycan lipid II flippase